MIFLNCTTEEWRIEATDDESDILIIDAQDLPIARVYRHPNYTKEWCDNNAKVMRASKEMFEMLDEIQSSYDDTGCQDCGVIDQKLHTKIISLLERITSNYVDYND